MSSLTRERLNAGRSGDAPQLLLILFFVCCCACLCSGRSLCDRHELNALCRLEPGHNMSNEAVLVEPPITTSTVGKRKGSDDLHEEREAAKKRPKKGGNPKAEPHASWPGYFQNVNAIVTSLLLCDLTHQYAALQGKGLLLCSARQVVTRPLRHSRVSIQ